MKPIRKMLAMGLCAVALVGASVLGTMAYFTDNDAVTNTFTVGRVGLELDEADVTEAGVPLDDEGLPLAKDENGQYDLTAAKRVEGNEYHLVPGHTYIKDPTVTVDAGSEDCWVFIKVEHGLVGIESGAIADDPATVDVDETYKTIAEQISDNGWSAMEGEIDIYAYNSKVLKNADDKDLEIFAEFKIDGESVVGGAKPETPAEGKYYLEDYKDAVIKVTAYAVQADGFETAQAAWEATFADNIG